MGNPYTELRRGLQLLKAEVDGMLQDAILEELRHEGVHLAEVVPVESPVPRRARRPKIEAPPLRPSNPSWSSRPDPDGDALPESPASRELASSPHDVSRTVPGNLNQFGVPRKGKVKPWEAEKNLPK